MTAGTAQESLLTIDSKARTTSLHDPTALAHATAFLWNRQMMIQVSCRGYAVAQFMQPEPRKYASGPSLEAKTFMQPEHPYYAHHPGRFVYVKDEEDGHIFSVPYEPVRTSFERFEFTAGQYTVSWNVRSRGLVVEWRLSLAPDEPVELWTLSVMNVSARARRLSVYPYFPFGYLSWMNQAARFHESLMGVVADRVTPYQKYGEYLANRGLWEKTYLIAADKPDSWEARQEAFEGEGGLHRPRGVVSDALSKSESDYEVPTAAMQYRVQLGDDERRTMRFAFGPALDEAQIHRVRSRFLGAEGFRRAKATSSVYAERVRGCLQIETPDQYFDHFVNCWLDRQMSYHGELNRLTTDPQTRNYLQDAMAMSYIRPARAKQAFLRSLSQQSSSGALPDGILLRDDAELKYINQVPHTDHCVWLPICLRAYLDETGDDAILDEWVGFSDGAADETVYEHVVLALRSLLRSRDERGLPYIGEGDWCDPMNMVGREGVGVSAWLTFAIAYALKSWVPVCARRGDHARAREFSVAQEACNEAANRHFWKERWYGRGITDQGTLFGVVTDGEGRMFLNPQSWAILSGAPNSAQRRSLIDAIETELETPYGPALLAPAFTRMREDIGRVTQKYPGTAENGSVYNHAAAFYIYALYQVGEGERAFRLLRRMLPGPSESDLRQRGQLPVFVPNYYRGAYHQLPRTAGRSSQLVHTGTVSWLYRCLVEGMFGLTSEGVSLRVAPSLPTKWRSAKAVRRFRGARFDVCYERIEGTERTIVTVDDRRIDASNVISDIEPGRCYDVSVVLPSAGTPASET